MSDLGELLELMHGARHRTTTVRATVRTWHHSRRLQQAMERSAERGEVTLYAVGPEEPQPETDDDLARVWFAPGQLAREERDGPDGPSVSVRREQLWWRYDAQQGALSNEDRPEMGGGVGEEFWWLLDAGSVIGLLDYDAIEPGECAGRQTKRARALPRTSAGGHDWPLDRLGAMGADELLLEVDAERGTLLRIESRYRGEPLAISEVVEISFDEEFPAQTFVFEPPPGVEVRSVDEQFAVQPGLTIDQAVARAPFTIWIAERVPADWDLHVALARDSDPAVFLNYRSRDGTHGFSIVESPADDSVQDLEYERLGRGPWNEVDRNGRAMRVREPAEHWQPTQVSLMLGGTWVRIDSADLEADFLVDVAAGLVPAPTEPPALRG